MFKYVGVYIL